MTESTLVPAPSAGGASPIFHIGYHRTSTTWFQQVFYPRLTQACILARADVRNTLIEPRAYEFDSELARAKLLECAGEEPFVACEENLSGYLHNGGLGGLVSREVARRIHASFPEARIVIFIRSQPAIVAASYAQYVRGGGTRTIDSYVLGQERAAGALKYWYKAPQFALKHFVYGPLIADYQRLFGVERVFVRTYESFAADSLPFLKRFAEELDIAMDWDGLSLDRVNASLSPRSLAILRRLNLFTPRSVQNKQYLCDIKDWHDRRWIWLRRFESVAGSRPAQCAHVALPDEIREAIHDACARDNTLLAQTLDLPLAEQGYPVA